MEPMPESAWAEQGLSYHQVHPTISANIFLERTKLSVQNLAMFGAKPNSPPSRIPLELLYIVHSSFPSAAPKNKKEKKKQRKKKSRPGSGLLGPQGF